MQFWIGYVKAMDSYRERSYLTVSELNSYINELFYNDLFLQNIIVIGEISGLKVYQQSGHIYFTLKDENSVLNCVMFKRKSANLTFKPENGMEVIVKGRVAVYDKQGRYQLYAEEMHLSGQGGMYIYLEQLKQRLEQQGYFAPEKKKSLPAFVQRVGVVSSQEGAALRDIIKVLRERNPGVEIIVAHSSVQGEQAPGELAQALNLLNEYGNLDVIIIGRGGGSFEDLMAFNSEEVVKAVYNSRIPVISAVGHEIDFSLCDLAADVRAATPTQAAQLAVQDIKQLSMQLKAIETAMIKAIGRFLSIKAENLDRIMLKDIWQKGDSLLAVANNELTMLQNRMSEAIKKKYSEVANQYRLQAEKLNALSPCRILKRGYAVVKKDQKIIASIDSAQIGDTLRIILNDGFFEVEVKDKEKNHGKIEF